MNYCKNCKYHKTDDIIHLCLLYGQSIEEKSEACIDFEAKNEK